MVVSSLSFCTIGYISSSRIWQVPRQGIFQYASSNLINSCCFTGNQRSYLRCLSRRSRRFHVFAATKGSAKPNESEEKVPSWAKPDSDEPPPWAREEGKPADFKESFEVPFFVYLLASAVTAIAAIGSIFEYVNQKPVFGVLNSDSIFYAPILGFFAFTGIPTSAFLWFKSVQTANKEAEEQDRRDGYM
ncbi:hypothetical protein V2J09_015563 [Rumex salicifolius]